jgi:hypothetical protein
MLAILYVGIGIMMLQSGVTALLFYIATGFFSILFTAIFLQLIVIVLSAYSLHQLGLTKSQYDILSNSGVVLVALIISGAGDAQRDKHLRYDELPPSTIRCKGYKIEKRVSQYWLAVAADNSRVLINQDCEPKFQVIAAEYFRALPDGAPADEISKLFDR